MEEGLMVDPGQAAPKLRSRKRKRGAPTHVASVPLRLTPSDRSLVDRRFETGRRVYNACLGEAIKRGRQVRSDPGWESARSMRSMTAMERKARSQAFVAINTKHGFTESDLMSFASSLRQSWVRKDVFAQETQVIGRRAFGAVRRWHLGIGGKPRFKPVRRSLHSMECKDLKGALVPAIEGGACIGVRWGNGSIFRFAPIPSTGRRGREQLAERERILGLIADSKVLSVRIVRTVIRERSTYKAQFVIDGPPPQRHPVGDGEVSFDLGPSHVAAVSKDTDGTITSADIHHLAAGLDNSAVLLRRLQRKFDRQHRAGSPDCFRSDGTHKNKERCLWKKRSKNAQKMQAQIADLHRRRAEYRKTSHGTLINQWLMVGPNLRMENLNYVAWQKNYPRSVRDRAPGKLVAIAHRKAESAGGGSYDYSPWTTALSQTCVCGAKVKKPLSQRIHNCPECGVVAQRDLFSAFLGMFVFPVADPETGEITDTLDLSQAKMAWDACQDIDWLPESRKEAPEQRGRRHRRSSRRSMARIKARRVNRSIRQSCRQEPTYLVPTAPVAA